jgi:hypothetical protein
LIWIEDGLLVWRDKSFFSTPCSGIMKVTCGTGGRFDQLDTLYSFDAGWIEKSTFHGFAIRILGRCSRPTARYAWFTPLPSINLTDVPEVHAAGYGSASAMEAACDARLIWSRATPPMRLIIGGLMDGKKQGEIATETGMNRFQVARMVAGLQRQFAPAA